jgi:transposase
MSINICFIVFLSTYFVNKIWWKHYIPKENIVFFDESGMGNDERPLRGYSKKGELCIGKKPAFSSGKINMLAGLCNNKIIEPLIYEGNCTAALVEEWFSKFLFPSIKQGSVIIMDNAAFHRKNILQNMAKEFGCTIKFLPPYSPDINDIEPWWAVIKSYARKFMQENEKSSLDEALKYAFGKAP